MFWLSCCRLAASKLRGACKSPTIPPVFPLRSGLGRGSEPCGGLRSPGTWREGGEGARERCPWVFACSRNKGQPGTELCLRLPQPRGRRKHKRGRWWDGTKIKSLISVEPRKPPELLAKARRGMREPRVAKRPWTGALTRLSSGASLANPTRSGEPGPCPHPAAGRGKHRARA